MPTVKGAGLEGTAFLAALDHALGRMMRPLVNLMPRRLRRAAERIEQRRSRPIGQIAAVGFLAVTILYGLIVSGQIGRVGDALLVFAGFGIEDVKISGRHETSDIDVLTKLEIAGSLISFDVAAAQKRVGELPWVEKAVVRKYYPSTLSVEITERKPYALWQKDGEVYLIDKAGTEIELLDESRFAKLPFIVGGGANSTAPEFLAELFTQPSIAERMRAAVLVSGRRWDLHLEGGVTVKLPEKQIRQALAQLTRLDTQYQLLERDVTVVDLRLPDRVTVRLPEGRSLEDVTSDKGCEGALMSGRRSSTIGVSRNKPLARRSTTVSVLDVGSTKICCMIARLKPRDGEGHRRRTHTVEVLGFASTRSRGIKSGVVVDLEQAEKAIRLAVDAAERMAEVTISSLIVNISCGRLKSETFSASVGISEAPSRKAISTACWRRAARIRSAMAAWCCIRCRSATRSTPIAASTTRSACSARRWVSTCTS